MADIRALRQNSSLDDAAFVAWANEVLYAPKTYFISYRGIRYQLSLLSGAVAAKAKTEAMMQAINAADPLAHQMLLIPGDELGSGGGIDISQADATAMLDQFQAAGLLSPNEAEALRDLGRTSHKRFEEWGLASFGQADLDAMAVLTTPLLALKAALPTYEVSQAPDGVDVIDPVLNIVLHYPTMPTLETVQADHDRVAAGANNG